MQTAFRAVLALLLAFPAIGVAAAEVAGLFSADDGAVPLRQTPKHLPSEDLFPEGGLRGETAGELAPSPELRSRVAAIDFGQLAAARSEVAQGRPSNLRLNLFADAEFQAIFERTAPTASGHTLTGRLADDPLSTLVLAVNGDELAGMVWGVDGIYTIRGAGGGVSIRQLDPSRIARCEGVVAPPAGREAPQASEDERLAAQAAGGGRSADSAPALSAKASVSADDGSEIDLLVVYPSYVRQYQGGHRAMRVLIDRDIAMVNEAYRIGGANLRIALAGIAEMDYEPYRITDPRKRRSAILDDVASALTELQNPSDGYLDEVHALRDSHAADIVLLHLGEDVVVDRKLSNSNLIVMGPSMAGLGKAFSTLPREDLAFSVSTSLPFAHELGHNMGLRHQRANDPGNQPFPYSHGHEFVNPAPGPKIYGTIMHSSGGHLFLNGGYLHRFSNPNQRFPDAQGVPLGVPGDQPSDSADGPADAVRSLNGTRRLVANFRASAARCSYSLSPRVPIAPARGGEFRIRVETASGCAWTAHSDRKFASVTGGFEGVGSGEVIYRLSANAHRKREAAILVAGEVYLVNQDGPRSMTPVCERAPAVGQAISKASGKPCAEIGAADLAAVDELNINGAETLRPGDFDGLSNLNFLTVRNGLASLQPDALDELHKLKVLDLRHNRLTALDPGIFEELQGLRSLHLKNNNLTTLEAGVFESLTILRALDLSRNDLTTLRVDAFASLRNMNYLHLSGNKLVTIEPGALASVPDLGFVQLNNNNLTTLPPDISDGLPYVYQLELSGNPLGALAPGALDNLPNMGILHLDNTGLKTLPPSIFDRMENLSNLHLRHNHLTTWKGRYFRNQKSLYRLFLQGNRIAKLPRGAFEGFAPYSGNVIGMLHLHDNPGAPFAFRAELIRLPKTGASSNRPAEIAIEVAQGAPLDMPVGLSVSGGFLSTAETLIEAGRLRGDAIRVLPNGGPVTVRIDRVHNPPPDHEPYDRVSLWGIRMIAGAPLVLHGLPDQTLALDGAMKFDLPTAFPGFGEGTSYAVKSSDPAVAAATIREGLLIVSASGGGETVVTVTARDSNGRRESRSFSMRVPAAPEAVGELADLSLGVGDSAEVALSGFFRDPEGGALTYAIHSAAPSVATASVSGGLATLKGRALGTATVTVTATDPDGLNATLSFKVKVEQSIRSRWGGWRSALLKPPSSEHGDES